MTYSNQYSTYITSNPRRTVFYVGVTNDIKRRMSEHFKNRGIKKTFAGRYYCYDLIYLENYFSIHDAIEREKELKNLSRESKIELIKSCNPMMLRLSV